MMFPDYYDFYLGVRAIVAENGLEKIPPRMTELKARKPLIITDPHIEAAGLVDIVLNAAKNNLTDVDIFKDVPVDSDYRVVDEISALYTSKGCDSIVAIGGGSVIDTAKGVNITASLGGGSLLSYQGTGAIQKRLNPFIVIPTTTGTGSEATLAAVISDPVRKTKMAFVSHFLLPDLAVIDPRMTRTLPDFLIGATAMDAMAHSCEAYYCLEKNPLSDALALKSIAGISRNLLDAIRDPDNTASRLALADASMTAGAAFSNSMCGMVHNIGHILGAVCRVPHGNCMAILLPYGLEYNLNRRQDAIGELLFPLAGPEVYAKTPKNDRAEKAIEYIRTMNEEIHLATGGKHPRCLKEIVRNSNEQAVQRSVLPEIAQGIMSDPARLLNPEEVLPNDALLVLEHAWDGTPLNRQRM